MRQRFLVKPRMLAGWCSRFNVKQRDRISSFLRRRESRRPLIPVFAGMTGFFHAAWVADFPSRIARCGRWLFDIYTEVITVYYCYLLSR